MYKLTYTHTYIHTYIHIYAYKHTYIHPGGECAAGEVQVGVLVVRRASPACDQADHTATRDYAKDGFPESHDSAGRVCLCARNH